MPSFPFDKFHTIQISSLKPRMDVDILTGVLRAIEPIHIELSDKGRDVPMFEMQG